MKIGNKQPSVWHRETDIIIPSKGRDGPKVVLNNGVKKDAAECLAAGKIIWDF